MRIVMVSHSSSLTFNSLAIDSAFSDSGIAVRMVGRPNFGGDNGFHPISECKRRDAG